MIPRVRWRIRHDQGMQEDISEESDLIHLRAPSVTTDILKKMKENKKIKKNKMKKRKSRGKAKDTLAMHLIKDLGDFSPHKLHKVCRDCLKSH